MLPPFIIDQIRKREEEARRRRERPVLELPLPPHGRSGGRSRDGEREEGPKEPERGVVIIDLVNG